MPDQTTNPTAAYETLPPEDRALIARVLDALPTADLLMTAAFDDDRAGTRLLSAARCNTEPPLVVVAARKGHSIEPLIRDSRGFAICLTRPGDKLLAKKFPALAAHTDPAAPAHDSPPDERTDPFEAMPVTTASTGAPIPERVVAALDCEVIRHFDLEADHELYVGAVVAAKLLNGPLTAAAQHPPAQLNGGEGI